METPELLLKAFEEQEDFVGSLQVNGKIEAESVHCRFAVNPVDTRTLKATIRCDSTSGDLMDGPHLAKIIVKSDSAKSDRLQVGGYLTRLTVGSGPDELKLDVREVFRFSSQNIALRDEGPRKVYMNWLFPPLKELGDAFKARKHAERGLVLGWKPDSYRTWEEGKWEPQERPFRLGDTSYTVRPALHFEDLETVDGEAYITIPRLHVKSEQVDDSLPWSFDHAVEKLKTADKAIQPLLLAMRFATGKRVGSGHQVQSTYDSETNAFTELERFQPTTSRQSRGVHRAPQFQRHWPLIVDVAQAIHRQQEDARQRTERAIQRYIIAFEAPFIEMQLVALHSALGFIVRNRTDIDVEPSKDLPSIKGILLTPLRKFITAKGIEWRDLIPKGREKEALFDFNKLRNAYLKDLDHKFDDIAPFETARRLFERVLLAHLNLNPTDYPDLN